MLDMIKCHSKVNIKSVNTLLCHHVHMAIHELQNRDIVMPLQLKVTLPKQPIMERHSFWVASCVPPPTVPTTSPGITRHTYTPVYTTPPVSLASEEEAAPVIIRINKRLAHWNLAQGQGY